MKLHHKISLSLIEAELEDAGRQTDLVERYRRITKEIDLQILATLKCGYTNDFHLCQQDYYFLDDRGNKKYKPEVYLVRLAFHQFSPISDPYDVRELRVIIPTEDYYEPFFVHPGQLYKTEKEAIEGAVMLLKGYRHEIQNRAENMEFDISEGLYD